MGFSLTSHPFWGTTNSGTPHIRGKSAMHRPMPTTRRTSASGSRSMGGLDLGSQKVRLGIGACSSPHFLYGKSMGIPYTPNTWMVTVILKHTGKSSKICGCLLYFDPFQKGHTSDYPLDSWGFQKASSHHPDWIGHFCSEEINGDKAQRICPTILRNTHMPIATGNMMIIQWTWGFRISGQI